MEIIVSQRMHCIVDTATSASYAHFDGLSLKVYMLIFGNMRILKRWRPHRML